MPCTCEQGANKHNHQLLLGNTRFSVQSCSITTKTPYNATGIPAPKWNKTLPKWPTFERFMAYINLMKHTRMTPLEQAPAGRGEE